MKITWENIDDFKLVDKGDFKYKNEVFRYNIVEECQGCKDEFFARKSALKKGKVKYCSHKCYKIGASDSEEVKKFKREERKLKKRLDRMPEKKRKQEYENLKCLFYSRLVGKDDVELGKRIRVFVKRNLIRNKDLYDFDESLEGIEFITCPVLGVRLIMIKSSYIEKILGYNIDDYPLSKEERSCSSRNDRIKESLSSIDEDTGLTKHKLSLINGGRLLRNISKDDKNYNKSYRKKPANYYLNKDKFYDIDEIRSTKEGYLETKCYYCKKWMIPTTIEVENRIGSIEGKRDGSHNFYCSDDCRKSCGTFNRSKYPKGFIKPEDKTRYDQPELRMMVFERDDFKCIKCGKSGNDLVCHHYDGILQNPIESADIDNCATLCTKCHKEAHQQEGCSTYDMRCDK